MPLGSSNAYLIPAATGYVLVDAGLRATPARLWATLAVRGLTPQALRLIVVTHVHFDHVGGLAAIQAASGAPVMVHTAEAGLLAAGRAVIPAGTSAYGRIVHRLGTAAVRLGALRFAAVRPDVIAQGGEALARYGLEATILHTPGHTAGSITVLLRNGDAFCGDTAVNHYPLGRGPIFPPFADDVPTLLQSWRVLVDAGATRLFPGHGTPFWAARLREHMPA